MSEYEYEIYVQFKQPYGWIETRARVRGTVALELVIQCFRSNPNLIHIDVVRLEKYPVPEADHE